MKTLTLVQPRRQLEASVASFAGARRRAAALQLALRGLAVGGVLAALVGSVLTALGLDSGPSLAGLILAATTLAAGVAGWVRQVPEIDVALEVDRKLDLDERVTTAWEMARLRPDHPLANRQIADAVAHLQNVWPGAVYPLSVPRRALVLAALGVALAVAPWAVPWPMLPGVRTPASQVAAVTRSEAVRLDDLANQLDSQKATPDQTTRAELATQLRRAATDLRQAGGNSQRASQALLRTQQAVASLAPQTGEDAALTLARIADALNSQAVTKPATQALDQQNPSAAATALDQLASALSSMGQPQRDSLASALQAASNAARASDTNASQELQRAAEAARNGDAQGLKQAGQALRQLGAASQAQNDVAQAQSALQASREAISQAAQTGLPRLSSALNPSVSPTSGRPSDQTAGQSGSQGQGQAQTGQLQGSQEGGGIGKGSTSHLGALNDLQGLAQNEVTVPTDQLPSSGSVSASNQLQAGAGGEARIDYRNVLPQYQKQALQAIEGNAVPPSLKQVVKGYFDSLAAR